MGCCPQAVAAAAADKLLQWTVPCEDVDVTLIVDEQFGDARLTLTRGYVQRRQTILNKIYIGA